ncbi:MAG: hypothetical protein ACLQGV_12100 [Bryobacteraceae bacterium]
MKFAGILCAVAVLSSTAAAQLISLPGTLTVPAISATGVSFVYSGTLTQAAIMGQFSEGGVPCMLTEVEYCTNGAGIVVQANGGGTVGASSSFAATFGGTVGIWNFGALLMTISGVGTVEVFPANAANGLGSGTPPANLTTGQVTLSQMGFPAFSVVNPTITFLVADDNYPDNAGSYFLTPGATATPAPPTLWLSIAALMALGLMWFVHKKYHRARSVA